MLVIKDIKYKKARLIMNKIDKECDYIKYCYNMNSNELYLFNSKEEMFKYVAGLINVKRKENDYE